MRRRSGFTLLELLVTSLLFVILTASLSAIFSNTARLYFLNRHNQTVSMELQVAADYIKDAIERTVSVDANYAPFLWTSGVSGSTYTCSSFNCQQPNNILFLYTRKVLDDGSISKDPTANEWTALCVQTGNDSRRQLEILTIAGDTKGTPALEHQVNTNTTDLNTTRDPYDNPFDADALGELSFQQNCERTAVAYHFFTDIRPQIVWDDPNTPANEDFAPDTISNPQFINQKSIDLQNLRFYPIYADPAGPQPIGWQVEMTAQPDVKNKVGIELRDTDELTNSGNVTVRFNAFRLTESYLNRMP